MKILMIITEGDLGGAQRHVLDVSRELHRRGHDVHIAVGGVFSEMERAATEQVPAIPVVRLRHLVRSINFATDIRAFFEIYRLVRKMRPDIVHCHSSKAGVIGSIAARCAGAGVVYTAHGFVFREELGLHTRFFYAWIERCASFFRHKIITVSQSDADAARTRRIASSKKIQVIPNGIDQALASELLDPSEARRTISSWCSADLSNAKIVLSIANFFTVKNIPLLIHAFESVIPRVPEARLVLIGDGAERALCERIVSKNEKIIDRVFFVGKHADAFRVLRGADVLCLTSTKEGMPYVVLEAKLAGTPIVATRVGGIPEMGEGVGLRLVVPHAPEIFSDAIVDVLREGKKMSEGGALMKPAFTLSGMVDAIEAVYRSVR